ncbi:DUF4825 domain-containing protein [Halobacillus salinus]|uniref:DUF4825 domain-containing protein n=1 Tax=Halobacillus salinus TaxID=192814 RepID=A0A4Z0H2S7_9BACI|nr:DUF4825 domain-containing protein [Halobacillus salinus]TGB03711.1 DUF4825 domain-containing protein [Halobacillus salinus]
MRRWVIGIVISGLLLTGCQANASEVSEDLFDYQGSYVGDNSAVVRAIMNGKGAENFTGVELQTKEEPYGVIATYDWTEAAGDAEEVAIHNASYLFTLLQNAEWVRFEFEAMGEEETYELTREELQAWYGVGWNDIDNEEELNELIEESTGDEEKVKELLSGEMK